MQNESLDSNISSKYRYHAAFPVSHSSSVDRLFHTIYRHSYPSQPSTSSLRSTSIRCSAFPHSKIFVLDPENTKYTDRGKCPTILDIVSRQLFDYALFFYIELRSSFRFLLGGFSQTCPLRCLLQLRKLIVNLISHSGPKRTTTSSRQSPPALWMLLANRHISRCVTYLLYDVNVLINLGNLFFVQRMGADCRFESDSDRKGMYLEYQFAIMFRGFTIMRCDQHFPEMRCKQLGTMASHSWLSDDYYFI